VLFCFDISSDKSSAKAFKLAIAQTDVTKKDNADRWPTRVTLRPWRHGIVSTSRMQVTLVPSSAFFPTLQSSHSPHFGPVPSFVLAPSASLDVRSVVDTEDQRPQQWVDASESLAVCSDVTPDGSNVMDCGTIDVVEFTSSDGAAQLNQVYQDGGCLSTNVEVNVTHSQSCRFKKTNIYVYFTRNK